MKSSKISPLVFFLLFLVPSTILAFNEPNGFMEYKFGSTPMDIQGTIYSHERYIAGEVKVFLSLSFLPLDQWDPAKSRLSAVQFTFDSSDYSFLKKVFLEKYGKPTSVEKNQFQTRGGAKDVNESLYWAGKKTFVTLQRFGSNINNGYASVSTLEWLDAQKKQQERKAKEAASGL